jgi:class 3 adenylate cyclase
LSKKPEQDGRAISAAVLDDEPTGPVARDYEVTAPVTPDNELTAPVTCGDRPASSGSEPFVDESDQGTGGAETPDDLFNSSHTETDDLRSESTDRTRPTAPFAPETAYGAPSAEDGIELDYPMLPEPAMPDNVEAPGLVVEDSPTTDRLDLEQQDLLMKLRAQQAEVLKTRFADHVVVMFTDLVGSTAYYEKFGDFMGRQKMLTHNALLFPIVTAHGGSVVKTIGDAIMACFSKSDAALAAAAVMQRTLKGFNEISPTNNEEIHIRIGLNCGPAIVEGTDLHGDVVNVASRLASQARPDEILLTEALAAKVSSWSLKALGPAQMKGMREPVKLFRLQWQKDVTDRAEMPAALGAPTRLPAGYTIRHPLGRGPLGVVYLADDGRTQGLVAIKVLHSHVAASAAARQRMHEELWALTRLDHPGVVSVLEYACQPTGEIFFVTEYVDGIDLSELVARHGVPPLHEIAFIGCRLAEVLIYAHKQGVTHGDLKPENVLLEKDGQVRLRDFGLSRAWTSLLTESATPLGNPAYMAPELLTGAAADPRGDVYSLGALLYFLAAGRPPVEGGATMQTLAAVAAGEITPLATAKPQVSSELIAIVDKAMTVSPGGRFAALGLMAQRLQRLGGDDTDRARETLIHYVEDTTARRTNPAIGVRTLTVTRKFRSNLLARVRRRPRFFAGLAILAILALASTMVLWTRPTARDRQGELPAAPGGPGRAFGVVASALSVVTEAGAEVHLDGKLLGRAPAVRDLAIAPGSHRLRIVHPSFESYDETVSVAPGEMLRLKIALKPR